MIANSCLRPVLLVVAAALTATGIGFSIAAVISPTWEVVLMREFQTEHEHGLWWDCARSVKTGMVNGQVHTNYGERHCTYKFDFTFNEKYPLQQDEVLDKSVPDSENANHVYFKPFHIAYLATIGTAVICGVSAIIMTTCACRNTHCAPVFIFTILTLISTAGSLGVFLSWFFISHTVDNRWVKGITAIYDTSLGDSYKFEQCATLCFLLAFFLGLVLTKYFVNNENKNRMSNNPIGKTYYVADERQSLIPIPPCQNFASPPQPQPSVQFFKDENYKPVSRQSSGDFSKSASRRGSAFESQRTNDTEKECRINGSALFDNYESKLLTGIETSV